MVEPEKWPVVRKLIDRAIREGRDPVESLDRAGLLMTRARRREVWADAMHRLLTQLTLYRPAEMLRRKFHATHQASPADMYAVMVEFIEQFRELLLEEDE